MGNIYLIIYYFVYLIAVFTVGSLFLNFLKIKFNNIVEKRTVEFAFGNLAYILLFFYLGFCHLIYKELLLFFYLLPLLFFIISLLLGRIKIILPKIKLELQEVLIIIPLTLVFLFLLPCLFSYPTAWDALAYHLVLPKMYLHDHYFSFYNWFDQISMPGGVESLFAWGEIFKEPRLANFQIFSFLFFLVIYFIYGIRYLFSRKVVLLALYILLFKQILFSQVSVTPFVDYPFALYGLIATISFVNFYKKRQWQYVFLLLIISIISFLIKYSLGLLFGFSLIFTLSLFLFFNREVFKKTITELKAMNKLIVIFGLLISIVPVIYWLIKNYLAYHNPVFPLLDNIFKGYNYNSTDYALIDAAVRSGSFSLKMLTNFLYNYFLLRVPDGNAGIVYEALFSLSLFIFPFFGLFNKEHYIRYCSILGLTLSGLIYFSVGFPSYRYLLVVAPALSLVTATVFFEFVKKPLRIYKLPFILLLLFSLTIQIISAKEAILSFANHDFSVGLKSITSDKQAKKMLFAQDNYKSIEFINKNFDKQTSKVLILFDNRSYYFNVPVIYGISSANGLFTNPRARSTEEIYKNFKEMGITNVFISENWGFPATLRKDLYTNFIGKYLRLIYSSSGTKVYEVKKI